MDLDLVYRQLVSASDPQARQILMKVNEECGEELLSSPTLPEAYVDFVCQLYSNPKTNNGSGLPELLMTIYTDRDKMSEAQINRIILCLESGFNNVTDERVAFSVGDFIARVASPGQGLALLRSMSVAASSQNALGGVLLGLDILRKYPGELDRALIDEVSKSTHDRASRIALDCRKG